MAGFITLDELLNGTPPNYTVSNEFPDSVTNSSSSIRPTSLTVWQNFKQSVLQVPVDGVAMDYPTPFPTRPAVALIAGSKLSIHYFFLTYVGQTVERMCIPLERVRQGNWDSQEVLVAFWRDYPETSFQFDIGVNLCTRTQAELITSQEQLIVGEMKTQLTFPLKHAHDICSGYGSNRMHDKAISQVHGCMLYQNAKFGFISTYKETYFIRARGHRELEISDPISHSDLQPTLYRCFYYILREALEDASYPSTSSIPLVTLPSTQAQRYETRTKIKKKEAKVKEAKVGSTHGSTTSGSSSGTKASMVVSTSKRMCSSIDELHQKFGKFGRETLLHVDDLWEVALPPQGKVKDFAMKMIRLSAAEYELPSDSTDWLSKNFGMMTLYYGPPPFTEGCIGFYSTKQAQLCFDRFRHKIKLSKGRSGMLKMEYEEAALRKVIHEVCIQHRLEDMENLRLAKMLFCGIFESDEASPFFLIREFHEPLLPPDQVSPKEFGKLLSSVHACGVLLNCENYFPALARVDSELVLLDMSSATFEQKEAKFREEREFLTGLCGG